MKRLLPLLLGCLLLTGCAAPQGVGEDGKLKIVATIWPEYQWVQAVLGENPAGAEVELLVDSGVDPHSFQPAVKDLLSLYTCDLLVYLGGSSDAWVEDALEGQQDEAQRALPLMEVVADELCAGDHDHEEGDDHHDHSELDEHIWLSLKKAQRLCAAIADALGDIDPANAAYYEANAAAYCAELAALDARYADAVSAAGGDTLIFADRFPFLYLLEDYGLRHEAAFPGCSAETEASFATILRLAEAAEETNAPALVVIDGSDGALARTVIEATTEQNAGVVTMNSMQSRLGEGDTYLSVMEENLAAMTAALG